MKNTLIAIVVTLGIVGASTSMAQDKMSGGKMGSKMQSPMMTMPTSTMTMGLSADEKKTAMSLVSKMSRAEKAVVAKRCSMCMTDKHPGMMDKMSKMSKMDQEKAGMAHMMSGLTKTEQATMTKMMGKMTAKEKAVSMKMMENCCMHGMKSK